MNRPLRGGGCRGREPRDIELWKGVPSMLSRTWQCANKRCGAQFHSYEHGNPPCPRCGCVRVGWVPGGGHVSSTKGLDASLKALAQSYGMSDINSASPSRLNRAMPKHDPVVADS